MESWRRADVPVLPGGGPAPRLYDTATGELVPAAAGPVATLYACGITPYDATHIGHAATYTAWDLLVRAWLDAVPVTRETPQPPSQPPSQRPSQRSSQRGESGVSPRPDAMKPDFHGVAPAEPARFAVVYVQNVTDVDDPLLERAIRDGEDWRELASREIQRYREDMEALRVLPPTHLIGAVEALPIIERFSARMAERGALYDVDEDVYFAKSADSEFGALSGPGTASGFDPAEMARLAAQRGGDPARPGKKDPLDCLVWRAEQPGEPSWDSPFGRGRPGWHVECAAIATEYLGPVFDVQAGGSDLVFPHHEMSASHARVALGPAEGVFARVYAHAGMVSYRGEKMSKSLGNLVFVNRLLADGVDPMAVRMALLAHHYRSDWEWAGAALGDGQARLSRWRAAMARAEAAVPDAALAVPEPGSMAADAGSGRWQAEFGAPGVMPPGAARPGAARRGAARPGAAEGVLAGVRARLRDDLDAPGALAIVDRWADSLLAEAPTQITPRDVSGARLVKRTADALLGISL